MQSVVGPGQTATGLTINEGDLLDVNGDGSLDRAAGGVVTDITINDGGRIVLDAGTADHTTVNTGGQLYAGEQSVTTNTVLDGGSFILGGSGSEANETIVNSGSYFNVDGGSTYNTIVNTGGTYTLNDNSPNQHDGITINSGGTIIIGGSYFSYSSLSLAPDSRVDLSFVSYGNNVATFSSATNSVDVSSTYKLGDTPQTDHYQLNLTGDYSAVTFSLSENGRGGVLLKAESACFCRGTTIRTPDGEARVECLRVGDEVLAADGRRHIIRWIGASAALANVANRPVVVRKNAFSKGSPFQDLFVTRGHSFLFRDVLIPIGELINHFSIVWDEAAKTIQVYHIELDVHAVLLANGAPAESYRDDGNRSSFSAQAGTTRTSRSMPTCAPVVTSGPIVDRTRQRLAEWAEAYRPSHIPDYRSISQS